jgi:hypothetical protein
MMGAFFIACRLPRKRPARPGEAEKKPSLPRAFHQAGSRSDQNWYV